MTKRSTNKSRVSQFSTIRRIWPWSIEDGSKAASLEAGPPQTGFSPENSNPDTTRVPIATLDCLCGLEGYIRLIRSGSTLTLPSSLGPPGQECLTHARLICWHPESCSHGRGNIWVAYSSNWGTPAGRSSGSRSLCDTNGRNYGAHSSLWHVVPLSGRMSSEI